MWKQKSCRCKSGISVYAEGCFTVSRGQFDVNIGGETVLRCRLKYALRSCQSTEFGGGISSLALRVSGNVRGGKDRPSTQATSASCFFSGRPNHLVFT